MSAFDIVGLLLSGIGGVIQAASLLKRLCDGNAAIAPLLEEAQMKSQRIHTSIAMLTDFFGTQGIKNELFSNMLNDFCEVEAEFSFIAQKLNEKSKAIVFCRSEGFVNTLININIKLTTHEHSLRIITMISSVVNSTTGKLLEKLDVILEVLAQVLLTDNSSIEEETVISHLRSRLFGNNRIEESIMPDSALLAASGSGMVHFALGKAFYEGVPRKQDFNQALRNFNLAFKFGEWSAAYYIGEMYYNGHGVKTCFNTAFKYFKLGADRGDAAAMNGTGFCCSFSHGTAVNFAEATKYFKMSAEGGNASGCWNYGFVRLYGRNVERNWNHAVNLLQQARRGGEYRANIQLGHAYERGIGVKRNPVMAFQLWKEAHLAGMKFATNYLARAYDEGIGCEKNVGKATALYRECAMWGTWESKLDEPLYGMRLILGKGVPKDEIAGLRIIRKSLTDWSAVSWSTYGDCFRFGYGVLKNVTTAAMCYARAIQAQHGRRGIIAAHVALGELHETGEGHRKDMSKASYHYRRAADQMDRRAQLKMGLFYESGIGVESHIYHAFHYFDLAARAGDIMALNKASLYYVQGMGVQPDRSASAQMLKDAAKQGDTKAKLFMKRIGLKRLLGLGKIQSRSENNRSFRQN